ncbi:MATE family multidrug efflux pump [Streptococcus equinus]|nr:MATE family multidrug efflux pump [Streptococcus equinus]VTS85906.1 MATE family multidrug efflux pump [Streptococcus equinus]
MSLTGPIQGLFIGALSGLSQAAGILIGRRLGEHDYESVYRYSKEAGSGQRKILCLLC